MIRRLGRWIGVAIPAMATAVTAVAIAGASSSSRLPPLAATAPQVGARAAAAPSEPNNCAGDPNPSSPGTVGPSNWPDETLSGGRGKDKIISTEANPICGYQGDDLIMASNGKPNEINGGPHTKGDHAIIDSADVANLTNVEWCKLGPKVPKWRSCQHYKRELAAKTKPLAPRAFEYPLYESALECRAEPGTGRRQIIFLREPWMKAVDATLQADWQTVAYAANLNRWDGTKWVFVEQNTWLWDRTFDSVPPPPLGNYWRRFDTRQRWFVWFYPQTSGSFRVSITYHWYATGNVPEEHEVTVWAGKHYGDFEGPGHQYCNFPS